MTEMIKLLQLLQLSDSAIPIGATAHSFGLEMLAALEFVSANTLEHFVADYLQETGRAEAVFCSAAWGMDAVALESLNHELSAIRLSKESREASIVLGRRLLRLCHTCEPRPEFEAVLGIDNMHHAVSFGFVCGVLAIARENTVVAFLHQTAGALISASQRLLPVGQQQASSLLWKLKPVMARIACECAGLRTRDALSFAPLLELASMRHRQLETRIFIS